MFESPAPTIGEILIFLFHFVGLTVMMLSQEKHVEIILLCDREGYLHCDISNEFNWHHPKPNQYYTVLWEDYFANLKRQVMLLICPDRENHGLMMQYKKLWLAKFQKTSLELKVPLFTVRNTLRKGKFCLFKLQLL